MRLSHIVVIFLAIALTSKMLEAKPVVQQVNCNVTSISEDVIVKLKKRIGVF